MNDLFGKVWMENMPVQESDIHWRSMQCHMLVIVNYYAALHASESSRRYYFTFICRSKNGKGSWNWRFKFVVTVPCKIPRLHIQMWDKDVFKWSDCIAEAVLDLKDLFKRARHEKVL